MISRFLYSAMLQGVYSRIRRVPLFGELTHKLTTRMLPQGTRFVVTVRSGLGAGLSLSVDPRYEAQYAAGLHENALLGYLASCLRPGDVLYDVGAHIGFVSLVGARFVGVNGKVFAFEADDENSSRILGHARMNSLPQIEVVCSAVWSECKNLFFQRAADASSRNTGSVLHSLTGSSAGEVTSVPAVTLDRFSEMHVVPNVVKIDVEGGECNVLEGAEGLLHSAKPALICEIHTVQASTVVCDWLVQRDYRWNWLNEEARFPRHLVAQARR